MTEQKKKLVITREFKANRQKVFNAFSQAEAMGKWWGPAGMSLTVLAFDFKPNGKFHYKMEAGSNVMYGLFVYGNILEPGLIEFVSSFSNEAGNIAKAPFDMDFPLQIFNQITLEETNGITKLVLQGHPINATPAQEATYYSIIENMQQGFNGTFNQLETYLSE